jgi:hypothetical protein
VNFITPNSIVQIEIQLAFIAVNVLNIILLSSDKLYERERMCVYVCVCSRALVLAFVVDIVKAQESLTNRIWKFQICAM